MWVKDLDLVDVQSSLKPAFHPTPPHNCEKIFASYFTTWLFQGLTVADSSSIAIGLI